MTPEARVKMLFIKNSVNAALLFAVSHGEALEG